MPLFTLIVPAHNRASLIGRTLDSVLSQPGEPNEVIVVDDGSTDGTPAVVERYGRRVTLLRQANRGPGAARNLALGRATGDYVAFLDSDDLWLPWTAATYAAVIARHDRPAFIAGKPFQFATDDDPLPAAATAGAEPVAVNAFPDYYASGDQWRWWSASSFVMRRDVLVAAGGFTDDWVNAEDADAAMRVGTAAGFVQVTSPPTFAWRKHAGSAMSSLDKTLAGTRRLIDEETAGRFPGGPARAYDRRRILSTYVRPLALDLLKAGDLPAAWDLYRRTFGWNVSLRRWKFLAGFPVRAALGLRAQSAERKVQSG